MSKRMTVITLALVLAVAAPFATAQEKASSEKPAPRLTLVEPIKDFGTVPKGEKITHAFLVKNTGNADLEIIAARPACGCTVADFDKILKPGQTGKVTAHVDTVSFAGPTSKSVTLETNDPNTPSAQLTISAIVKPYVEAYPAGFVRFNMLQGDSETQAVTLYSEEVEPFQIVKIESPHPWIKVEPVKADKADPKNAPIATIGRPGQDQYKLNITVGGNDAKIGPLAEKIRVVTNSKHQPEYLISVAGVVRPTFRVEPTQVNFGEVTFSDTAATRTVLLRSNNLKTPETFVVNKVESSVPGVTALLKPTDKKGEYEVTLQVAKTAKPGDLAGEITIHTTDKIKPVVTIPVKAMVKATS